MNITRLFQDCEGEIIKLRGLKLQGLNCLYSKTTNQVILFWLKVNNIPLWIRVFIDGIYCGIDSYEEDASKEDADSDDDSLINHDNWVNGLTIISAFIESETMNEFMILKINFTQNRQLILDYREDGNNVTLKII
jgi:hypothetical protein